MKRQKTGLVFIGLACAALRLHAGALVEASVPSSTFSLDTLVPRAMTTSGSISLPCASGATVAVTSPAGKSSTLAAGTGAYTWTPDEGGFWTLSNSKEGTTTFTVRYSNFPGTEGAGTEASPLKVVDEEELVDLVAAGRVGNGTVFTLCGGDNLLSRLERPEGYGIVAKADGNFALDSSDPRLVAGISSSEFVLDLENEGPNRRGNRRDLWPDIAYTGDGWAFAADAASTLTLTPPEESPVATAKTGTGAVPFIPHKSGTWTVTLAYGSTVLTGEIKVCDSGMYIMVR